MQKTLPIFDRYRPEVDAEMRSVLDSQRSPLYDMMRYHLGWIDEKGNPVANGSGKALRPTLCLLACEAVNVDYHRALPAAAAIELLHNYSLIHDDVQDDDLERRHRPTVWSIWGKPQAINAGTAMRTLANVAIWRLQERGVPVTKRMQVQRLLDETSLKLIEGQYLDIDYERRLDITVDDYLHMIEGKTAALIACALEIGALLGTDDVRLIDGFRSVGKNLGMAFQIRDDMLGIWGEPAKTGKPLGSDIRRRKKTLPVVLALEKTEHESRQELLNFYRNGVSDAEVIKVVEILETAGAQAGCQELAQKYCIEARQTVAKMPLSARVISEFEGLACFLAERWF